MTINTRNRMVLGLIILTLTLLILLTKWIIKTTVTLEMVASISIMSAVITAFFIFIMIFFVFSKTNAPELMLLLSYGIGMLLQPMRFFLTTPHYISEQTLASFGMIVAVFGYFLALSSLMFMGLVELNAIKIRIENFFGYFAVLLYIFVSMQPLQTTTVQTGYFLAFSNPSTLILLRVIIASLTMILSFILFFSKEDSHKPYFAISIVLLGLGLHTSWESQQLLITVLGIVIQWIGFIFLFILIRRRYLWFKST